MADDVLFIEHSHLIKKVWVLSLLYIFEYLVRFYKSFPHFSYKNHKYYRLSLRSCDSLQLFLYLCGQNLTNQIENYV